MSAGPREGPRRGPNHTSHGAPAHTSGLPAGAFVLGALALTALPAPMAAQDPTTVVASTVEGWVSFILPLREEMWVCSRGLRMGDDHIRRGGSWSGDQDRCTEGAGRVRLRVQDGEVLQLEFKPADTPPGEDRDLGLLPAATGAAYLLALAGSSGERVADRAVAPAALARDVEAWPSLLALARNDARPRRVRRSALFWVGQAAGERVAGELQVEALDGDDLELRRAAVFSLSQLDGERGLDALLEVARSDVHGEVRKAAFFWLAQVEHPRVTAFFEEVLRGGG